MSKAMNTRWVLAAVMWCAVSVASAAGGAMQLLEAKPDLGDRASLQSGARMFVNYCMGCHSMQFMRYKRMGEDLGLTDQQVVDNLMFAADKVVEPMGVAMRSVEAAEWFGVSPPDLSVIARSRGADWIYSYLVSFYLDSNPARSFGVNNVVFPGAGMPHALWSLQGHQKYVAQEVEGKVVSETVDGLSTSGSDVLVNRTVTVSKDGQETTHHVVDRLQTAIPGSMSPGEYRSSVRDLVNFLVYAGEPAQLQRYGIGLWVLLFLAAFFVVARLLYKEYWRDVH